MTGVPAMEVSCGLAVAPLEGLVQAGEPMLSSEGYGGEGGPDEGCGGWLGVLGLQVRLLPSDSAPGESWGQVPHEMCFILRLSGKLELWMVSSPRYGFLVMKAPILCIIPLLRQLSKLYSATRRLL